MDAHDGVRIAREIVKEFDPEDLLTEGTGSGGNYLRQRWRKGFFSTGTFNINTRRQGLLRVYPWTVIVKARGYGIIYPKKSPPFKFWQYSTQKLAKTAARNLAAHLRKALAIYLGKERMGRDWDQWTEIKNPTKRKRVANAMVKVLKG